MKDHLMIYEPGMLERHEYEQLREIEEAESIYRSENGIIDHDKEAREHDEEIRELHGNYEEEGK